MRRRLVPSLGFLFLFAAACTTTPQTQNSPDTGRDGVPVEASASTEPGAVEPAPKEGPSASSPALPDGAACDSAADCAEGEVCEGLGCGEGEGRCASTERMCTRDLAIYCGCDGQEFRTSGSCSGQRYVHRGPCEPELALGEPCTDGAQCASKMCSGEGLEGCGRGAEGICTEAACTEDLAPYCGCNGFEFRTSGTCPNRQFAYRGPCESGASE